MPATRCAGLWRSEQTEDDGRDRRRDDAQVLLGRGAACQVPEVVPDGGELRGGSSRESCLSRRRSLALPTCTPTVLLVHPTSLPISALGPPSTACPRRAD